MLRAAIVTALLLVGSLTVPASSSEFPYPLKCGVLSTARSYDGSNFAVAVTWNRGKCTNPGYVELFAKIHRSPKVGLHGEQEVSRLFRCPRRAARCSVRLALPIPDPVDLALYKVVSLVREVDRQRHANYVNFIQFERTQECRSVPLPDCNRESSWQA